MHVNVFKVPQSAPDDLSHLEKLISSGQLDPHEIVAVMGKTEGNGCVNDFTRGFATQTLKHDLQTRIGAAQAAQVITIISGGTEGILSPHLTIFTRRESQPQEPQSWGLVLGISHTRNFLASEIGTLTMVQEVAAGVRAAMADAGLSQAQVHFVQIKSPLLTADRIRNGSGQVVTEESYKSMAFSRAASALGTAVALGEIRFETLHSTDILHNLTLYSQVASASAGIELLNCQILVLGNAPSSSSDLVISHDVMQHALDQEAVRRAIQATGQPREQIVNLFAKAEADPSGMILNQRHTMLQDSDINHTRMARAVVGAVIAAEVQDPMIYVSGGSEHQGPAGGGPVAVIARKQRD
ncbi:MAG: ring-opening amidohydrolase [Synechococcaceae cyanobacterium SM2_3_1]|nr:ring-opening amidohydrolase [Synechococcaceae cyanobacterium SM2_3_1]